MFENLSDKLQRSFKNLRGEGTLTEENISEAIREIRLALLESDVNLNVVNEVVDHIHARALGTQVTTALSPSEQIVKIVHDELINVLGKDTARFKTSSQPPSVILMAGLQGSGKTTTSGKLAQWLKKSGHRPRAASHRRPHHRFLHLRRQARPRHQTWNRRRTPPSQGSQTRRRQLRL